LGEPAQVDNGFEGAGVFHRAASGTATCRFCGLTDLSVGASPRCSALAVCDDLAICNQCVELVSEVLAEDQRSKGVAQERGAP
jgi:hypothetical protein